MTKAEATILKTNLDAALTYIADVIAQQIRALMVDIDNLTQEE